MRDDIEEYAEASAGPARLSFRQLISAWTGTALAIGCATALGWWAWGLSTQDPGHVPIVVAQGGPLKERPEDGAIAVANSDIESYGLATEASLDLGGALAPETEGPTDEDLPLGALATMAATLPRDREVEAEAPPERPAEGTEVAALDPDAVVVEGPQPAAGVGSKLAPASTPLAPARPADLPRRVAAARAEAATEKDSLVQRAARSAFQLQLGAYLSEDLTRSEWRRISRAHSELLHNRALAIQTTQSGGKTYYRLRVGPFEGLAEAASVCEALQARGQDCIPAGNQ